MIGLVGLDHHWAPAEVRGRLTFTAERLRVALRELIALPAIDEAAVLSTCHRTEIYVATGDWHGARQSVERFLAAAHELGPEAPAVPSSVAKRCLAAETHAPQGPGVDGTEPPATSWDGPEAEEAAGEVEARLGHLAAFLYAQEGSAAVRHLMQVAAGLRSMVVGESQVLGQVREALAAADAAGTVGEDLRALFVEAIRVGKRVRAETNVGRANPSLAAVAVQVADEALGGLVGKAALVVGAGRTSHLCAELLRAAGVGRIVLANRTPAAAAELAAAVGGETIALDDVCEAIGSVDLVFSATAAPHVVLSAATVACGLRGRRRPLVIMDLAVPEDVEAAAGLLPQVILYTLDQLRAASQRQGSDGPGTDPQGSVAASGRDVAWEAELARANEIVDVGVRTWLRKRQVRQTVPGIAALRRHVDRSEQAELARTLAELERLGQVSEAERAAVARFGQRLVDKMFHHLVGRIRALAEYDEVPPEMTLQVLARLFADPEEQPEPDPPSPDGPNASA